jgi:hypothetical protein
MQVNRSILSLITICILMCGCVEPYYLSIEGNQRSLVIVGQITDLEGYHYINISRSSPQNDPQETPEEGCQVEVLDDKGNSFLFYESEPGMYEQWLNQDFLSAGTQYRLHVTTADGKEYQSEYDSLLPCPPIDSVYYHPEIVETSDPEDPLYGIQFYIDLEASDEYARSYNWVLEETWEYHVPYHIQYIWDGTVREMEYPFIFKRCWKTESIHEINTLTTRHLNSNKFSKYPLQYVSSETNRLRLKYSLLIKQHSLSDAAYNYWDQLKIQSQESGGLHEIQPVNIRGNISNIHDPSELVLGNFYASSVTEKRVFVSEDFDFPYYWFRCHLDLILPDELTIYRDYPIYLLSLDEDDQEGPPYGIAPIKCFDCREGGGTIEKPEFWK